MGTLASLVVIGSLGSLALSAGSAHAATGIASVKLTDNVNPVTGIDSGATVAATDPSIMIPAGATIISAVISGASDGTADTAADDKVTLNINDSGVQTFAFNAPDCQSIARGIPSVDFSALDIGSDTPMHFEASDTCGGGASVEEMWLVVTYSTVDPPSKLHTSLSATPIVADVLPRGALVKPHLFELSATLTSEAPVVILGEGEHAPPPPPVEGALILFTNGDHLLCRAHTDSHGVARCFGLDKTVGALLDYRATFAGDSDHFGSTDSIGLLTVADHKFL